MYHKIPRRLFLALVFFALASRQKIIASEVNFTRCEWCWIGGVTDGEIVIKAKLSSKIPNEKSKKQHIKLLYSKNPNLDSRDTTKVLAECFNDKIATFKIEELEEDSVYYYQIVTYGRKYPKSEKLKFKTVKKYKQYNFSIACSSCSGGNIGEFLNNGVSNNKVFDIIAQHSFQDRVNNDKNLSLFIHMGDLHYRNDLPFLGVEERNIEDYRKNYDLVMQQERQRNLYQNLPLAYIWDDHDYGSNDANKDYGLKNCAALAYREQFPHYDLEDAGAIYQSFIIGRVRFIMTDCRFYREPIEPKEKRQKYPDCQIDLEQLDNETSPYKTLLGNKQRKWLLGQLCEAKKQQETNQEGLTIWVNSVPWIGDQNDPKTESWNQYHDERATIANFIEKEGINKLLMLSGDAHMLAIDDGKAGTTRNCYASEGGGSFPIIQAAALSSRGSVKGGPYNGEKYIVDKTDSKHKDGAIPGSGQWGLLNFQDYGDKIEVNVELKRQHITKIAHKFTF